jgi:ribonuclease HIII
MKNFFKIFKRRTKTEKTPDKSMETMLHALAMTEEQELSCDEVFALVDQFAEMHKRGEDASQFMPLVQKHLNMCPDCREEYEALLKMMETSAE